MKKNTNLILLTITAIALLFVGCGGNTSDIDTSLIINPNTASGVDKDAKMPIIKFEKEQHDFGRLSTGEVVSYSFKFTNTGNADLIVKECTATCGCTVADYPKNNVKPGEKGFITVTFNSANKRGQQMQTVTVGTNAQPSRYILKIIAQVEN
ncbi:MAG: DUF1573 domain-containing protein [Bacteroidales bacterium]|nr:DUF1573 domain-containing protein [Bacteroidales bacterium]